MTTRPQIVPARAANGSVPAKSLPQCSVSEMLTHPDFTSRMRDVLPRHLSPERMLRVAAQAISKTPKLAQCNTMSLLGALMACGSFGLEPNTPLGHAYLIPFEKRRKNAAGQWETEKVDCQLIIGYRGFIDLARRSGSLVSIHADVVYEGDEFSFEYGSNQHLRHVPRGARGDRKPLWAYAFAKLTGQGEVFDVLPYEQVLEIRNASQGYQQAGKKALRDRRDPRPDDNPWIGHEHEMAAKTMVRRLSKTLPMSIEFASAAMLDGASDGGRVDFSRMAQGSFAGAEDVHGAIIDAEIEEDAGQIAHQPGQQMGGVDVTGRNPEAAPQPVEAAPPPKAEKKKAEQPDAPSDLVGFSE